MVFEYRNHPQKGIYVTIKLLSVLLRVPYWVVVSIFSRQRKMWTWFQSFAMRLVAAISPMGEETGVGPFRLGQIGSVPDHRALHPSAGVKALWIDPVPHLIVAELKKFAELSKVEPITIPGYWIAKKGYEGLAVGESPIAGEKVLYGLHGGAYMMGSASSLLLDAGPIYTSILERSSAIRRTFSIEYRLSCGRPFKPTDPFPAALLDALAGYNYLVNVVGISPADIIVVGDSAGGNLALALTRYLVEQESAGIQDLPSPPGSLILASPWSDLSNSHYTPGSSTRFGVWDLVPDPSVHEGMIYAVDAFVGPHGRIITETSRYLSPSCLFPSMEDVSFKGFPRTFIVGGEAETFVDQIRTLYKQMVRDLGETQVTYYEAPDAIHDFLVLSFWEPERSKTLKKIADWIPEGNLSAEETR